MSTTKSCMKQKGAPPVRRRGAGSCKRIELWVTTVSDAGGHGIVTAKHERLRFALTSFGVVRPTLLHAAARSWARSAIVDDLTVMR